MARRGILAVAVTAALLLSIAAGYLFSGMMAARMAGLKYYKAGGEAVAARTEAVTAAATAALAAGKEGQGAAGVQEAVTAYAGRGRMISYTASMSLLVPREGVKRCVDAILSLASSYGGYISSLSVWEDRAVLAVKVPQGSMMAFVAQPAPITFTFTTRTTATITRTMILGARSLDYWDPSASCYVWFRVMNATGGSRLAEAGVKVLAGAP